MKKNFFYIILSFWLVSVITPGCVSLKQVNDYSAKSLAGVQKFEDIDYSFSMHCLDRCEFEAIRKFDIKRDLECDCGVYKTADSVTLLIYEAVKGYFGDLTSISGNNLTAYNFDALKKALTAGTFGDIKIEKEQVNAYSKISTILLRATTDFYRKRKIKQYIEEANEPIQVLLEKLNFILTQNLEDELNFKKEKLYAYYKEMSLDGNITDFEKGKATIDYYRQLADVAQKQQQIETFVKGLRSIARGHQKLYDNRDKITAKEMKALISQYSSDIQDIISEFNKLKK